MRTLLAGALVLVASCATPPDPVRTFVSIEEARAREVAGVLFLVGDAGEATREYSPLLHKLRAEVERWTGVLDGDRRVTVAFLGDNVYPEGLRERSAQNFVTDSTRLYGQVWTVAGPVAVARGARGIFVAGNHDSGNMVGPEGVARLSNMDRALRRYADAGIDVRLAPAAGEPGPESVALGGFARLIALDTNWLIQAANDEGRREVLDRLAGELRIGNAGLKIVVAHHPYRTAGAHSGLLGPRADPYWLFRRTGTIVQSVSSEPFQRLLEGLGDVFERTTAPFIYAGGHDHSLQLFEARSPRDPVFSIVSGAGSVLTPVADVGDLAWGSRAPGFMRILFRTDGGVELFVEAIDESYADCEERAEDRDACIASGVEAFQTVYSRRLR